MKLSQSLLGIFVLSVISCGIAATTKKIVHIPPEAGEKILEEVLKCVSKHGLDSAVVSLLKEGKFYEDNRVIEALLCSNQNLGFGNADGRVNVDKVMNDLFQNKPEIRSVMEACEKDYGKGPVDTFKSFMLCFKDKSPVKITL